MQVYRSLESYTKGTNSVATIGTFDGIHIGHQAILTSLMDAAHSIQGESVLISFHPHPRFVLFPENNPLRLLQSLDEKIEMLDQMGIDKLLLIPFTKDFSRMSSKEFIRDVLVDIVGIKKIIIGYDHHFGKNRTGNIDELQELSQEYHYEVYQMPAQSVDSANVSSTKIRKCLEEGDIQTANKYLGYAFALCGTVVHGEKQGRQLGYPTANIEPDDPMKQLPTDGIYFVKVQLPAYASKSERPPRRYYGMMSIGVKPTMGEFARTHEVNIFQFNEDIYGQSIKVEFLEYLRGEEKFDSLEDLIEAMGRDKDRCMEMIRSGQFV